MSVFLKSLIPSKSHPSLSTHNNNREERRREKNGLGRRRPWILSWSISTARPGKREPEPFPHQNEHDRKPTYKAQTSPPRPPNQPGGEAHTHPGAGNSPRQCLPHSFPASSSRQERHGVMDVPVNCSYLPSFVMKRQASLASPYSLLCRIFQAPNPSLLAQVHPVSLFNGRCHLLLLWKSGMVWPPHSSKLEVPSFTWEAWKMLWSPAVLMSWGILDL